MRKNLSGRVRLDWPETALRLAFKIAEYRSQDPYVQVGATAIKHDGSIIMGYNGSPSGIEIDWKNRNDRRKRVLHAEANVLNFVMPEEVKLMAVTHLPCCECVKLICQKKIKEVYYSLVLENYDNELTFRLAKEFKIELLKISIDKNKQ